MSRHLYIMTVLTWALFLGLAACSNSTGDKPLSGNILAGSSAVAGQQTTTAAADSLTMQKEELAKIYAQAIAAFIKAAYKKDKTSFDTLYFGKHVYGQTEDFPDIELPETIEKTQIRLVTPEAGQKKRAERKSLVYVNMMGWVDKKQATFLLVVFTNGAEHQYDYHLHFTYNTSSGTFELNKISFEDYLNSKGQKPKQITIYEDGKYSGDE